MPDTLDANGLQVKTFNETLEDLKTSLTEVLGSDANFDSNTPDGNLINTVSLLATDLRNLLVRINSNFDPDQAEGIVLNQRVAINNIQRQGGTFTLQDIEVVVDRSLTLQGLDSNINEIDAEGFTISDGGGTNFILANTVNLTAGTHTLSFRAEEIGAITTSPNTITNLVDVVLGVVSVNNPTGAQEIRTNEETSPQLRLRRARSQANSGANSIDSIFGNILNISGVTDAKVYENNNSTTDINGVPSNSIWAIVQGGSDEDIANTIEAKRSGGCGMKGDVVFDIINSQGTIIPIKFDRPLTENLYIKFSIKKTNQSSSFNIDGIKDYIVNNLDFSIGDSAETSLITSLALQGINTTGGGGVPLSVLISKDNVSFVEFLEVSSLQNIFTTSNALIDITEL